MQSFLLIPPAPCLAPYIRHYWILQDDSAGTVAERTLPTGCIQLVFHKRNPLLSLKHNELQPRSFLCGHDKEYADVQSTGPIEMITVVFQPYAAKAFVKAPVYLFYGKHTAVEDMDDMELALLARQIAGTPDNETCIRLIEHFLLRRLTALPSYNLKRLAAVMHEINRLPRPAVSHLAATACLSDKQFNRIFREYIGSSPKEYARIIRLQRALSVLQQNPSVPFARLAYDCGFADQSHMIKEFKAYSGYTPAEYLAACAPYSDYFSGL